MKNKEYLYNLAMQYKAATGSKNIDLNSPEFIKEVIQWAQRRQISGHYILKLLDAIGVDYDTPQLVEIGKGTYDTLVYPYDTTIITPYTSSFTSPRPSDGKVITEQFKVIDSAPILVNNNDATDFRIINPAEINMYMISNPYTKNSIYDLIQLHTKKDTGIIFSIHGKINDKDREEKVKMLNELKSGLLITHSIREEYAYGGDNYWNVVVTDMTAKTLQKTK